MLREGLARYLATLSSKNDSAPGAQAELRRREQPMPPWPNVTTTISFQSAR